MPDKQPRPELTYFPVDSLVEVRSDDDGFVGSWFEATISKFYRTANRYKVMYEKLVKTDGSQSPLEEKVDCGNVRPRPEVIKPDGKVYALHELVDALHNDGWWAGVVVGLPVEEGSEMYWVCFPRSREKFEIDVKNIRRPMRWIDGEWVAGVENVDETKYFPERTRVEVSRDSKRYGVAWFSGTIIKHIGGRNFLVKYEHIKEDGDDNSNAGLLEEIVDVQYIRPPPTCERNKFDVLEKVEAFLRDGWVAATITKDFHDGRYLVTSEGLEPTKLSSTSIRPRSRWSDGEWSVVSQSKHKTTKMSRRIALDECEPSSNSGKRRRSMLQSSSEDADLVIRPPPEGNNVDDASPDIEYLRRSTPKKPTPKKRKLLSDLSKSKEGMLLKCGSGRVSYSGSAVIGLSASEDTKNLKGRRTPRRNIHKGNTPSCKNTLSRNSSKRDSRDKSVEHDHSNSSPVANLSISRKKHLASRVTKVVIDAMPREDGATYKRNKKIAESRVTGTEERKEDEERSKVACDEAMDDGNVITNPTFSVTAGVQKTREVEGTIKVVCDEAMDDGFGISIPGLKETREVEGSGKVVSQEPEDSGVGISNPTLSVSGMEETGLMVGSSGVANGDEMLKEGGTTYRQNKEKIAETRVTGTQKN